MREHVNLPNLITTGNLACGFAALLLLPHSILQATLLVVLAAVLDSVDGALARRQGKDQRFGAELDSLADLVSFGVVPAMAVHYAFSAEPDWLVLPVAAGFLICGAWRLARFPLVKQRTSFVGLPITLSGILVMLLATWVPPLIPALIVVLVISGLMVSTVPFPTVTTAAAEVSAFAGRRPRRPRLRRRDRGEVSRPGRPHRPPRVGAWARAEISRVRRLATSARRRRRAASNQPQDPTRPSS